MQNNLTPRFLLIGLVLVWGLWSLWPTFKLQTLSEQEKTALLEQGELVNLETRAIKQGLDLKGGMYIALEVDIPTLVEKIAINKDRKLASVFESTRQEILISPETDFFNSFSNLVEERQVKLSRYYYDYGSNSNDIITALKTEAEDAIDRVLEILQNRIDQFGVAEPTIQKQGTQRIIVELAGVQNSERARALLESTALLEFYLVKDITTTNDFMIKVDQILKKDKSISKAAKEIEPIADQEESDSSNDKAVSVSELFGADESSSKNDSAIVDQDMFTERPFSSLLRNLGNSIGVPEKNVFTVRKLIAKSEVKDRLASIGANFLFGHKAEEYVLNDGSVESMYSLYLVDDQAELTGGVVEEAKANLGPQGTTSAGQPIVNLSMNSDGSRKWAIMTGSNVGRRVAIVLDNKVHMAPNIREKISGGGTLIEGFANIDEAKDIAIVLRAGALPAPVEIIEERVVGPSLGAESVKRGTQSVLIGLTIVLIFILSLIHI